MSVLGVVADTHCEPGEGNRLPDAVLDALSGVDLVIHCGDIIDARTLDRLAEVAPVVAVRSPVDPPADSVVLHQPPYVLERDTRRVGLLSRPADLPGRAELADGPLTDVTKLVEQAPEIFGGPVDAILYRGSHGAHVTEVSGVLTVDPGSPTCWDGRSATVGRLSVTAAGLSYEVVDVTVALPWRVRWGWPAIRLRQDAIDGAYAARAKLASMVGGAGRR